MCPGQRAEGHARPRRRVFAAQGHLFARKVATVYTSSPIRLGSLSDFSFFLILFVDTYRCRIRVRLRSRDGYGSFRPSRCYIA
jgi:hypothetical protein